MPVIKTRGSWVRVYRPVGARYAQVRSSSLSKIIPMAAAEFFYEFGYIPKPSETVIEINGVTGDYVCDFFEIKEPVTKV